jgi:hypothetical protein
MGDVISEGAKRCVMIFLMAGLVACGSGSDGDKSPSSGPSPTPESKTGVFLDTVVSGLDYVTDTQSGTTDDFGQYQYIEGEAVTFSIGGIILGSTLAGPVVTPLALVEGATDVTNPQVINIVRLLLTLDEDGNPDNGIRINDSVRVAAADQSIDFSSADFDTQAKALIDTIKPGATLVAGSLAQNHFAASLKTSWGTSTWSTDCWGSVCANL